MGQGLKAVGGNPASPPYRNGPYTWDQQVTFAQGSGAPTGEGDVWYVDGTNGASGNNGKVVGQLQSVRFKQQLLQQVQETQFLLQQKT